MSENRTIYKSGELSISIPDTNNTIEVSLQPEQGTKAVVLLTLTQLGHYAKAINEAVALVQSRI